MDILTKWITKNEECDAAVVRERYGVFASITGIVSNIILALFKFFVGLLSGSIAIIADSVNNFSDAGASLVSFVSFKIAAKPADRDHPFGHARIEYVCSMVVAFLILLVGVELMTQSVGGFFTTEHEKLEISALTIIILSVSILVKFVLGLFYRSIGKKINSSVISASGMDSFSDAISTLAVLASSIVINLTDLWFLDSIVGVCVSGLIIIAGLRILNETKNSLLGEPPVDEVIDNIMKTVEKYEEVIGIHDLMVHNYGPNHYIASFHAEVDGKEDVFMLHDAIDNLERELNSKLGIVCTIHMDPIVTDDEEVNRLRSLASDVVESLFDGASIHDFRTVIGHTHTNLIFDIALPFEVKESPESVIEKVSSRISELAPNHYCVITIDRE